jgi:hypothetical protein
MSLPRFRRACASAVASTVLLGGLGLGAAQPATAAEGRDPALWPFAVDSPWNMPIGSGARLSSADDPRVATLVRGGSRVNANEGYSHPVYQASTSDPEAIIEDVSVPGRSRKTRVPVGASPATGSDGHLHVISPDKQHVHETWIATRRSDTHLTARRVERNDLAGPGILQGGTRAYGGSAIGGLVRRWEMDQRSIRHAVAVAMDPAQLRSGAVWPANATTAGTRRAAPSRWARSSPSPATSTSPRST